MTNSTVDTGDLSADEKRVLLERLLRERATAPVDCPLSEGQRALWFLHRLAPDSPAYNLVCTVRIETELDVGALRRAFVSLIRRHASLRTTYALNGDVPIQRIHPKPKVVFDLIDASGWDDAKLKRQVDLAADVPFCLEQGPVIRAQLFSRTERRHVLMLACHHIAADLWSLAVILSEQAMLYRAERSGLPVSLPNLSATYTEYVRYQRELLDGPTGENLARYWQEKLRHDLPVLELPTDRPRPPVQRFRGQAHRFELSQTLSHDLVDLASRHVVSLYTLIGAAFFTLLYRYTGQEDLVIGTPMLSRGRADFQQVVGYFSNAVVLRSNIAGKASFVEFLRRAHSTVNEAIAHQEFPFGKLVEKLSPARDPSRPPLFQVMFAWEKIQHNMGLNLFGSRDDVDGIDFDIEAVDIQQRGAPFDLMMQVFEREKQIAVCLQYDTDLFNGNTIRRMAGHFERLLTSIVADPDAPIRNLPMLTKTEWNRAVWQWNSTDRDYVRDGPLHELFEAQVSRNPQAVAVVFEDQQLTYEQLNARADKLAAFLRHAGIKSNELIGVYLERSVELVVALLGIFKAGAAYVPLNPDHPSRRLETILLDAQIQLVLSHTRLIEKLCPGGWQVVPLDRPLPTHVRGDLSNAESHSFGPETLAYVIYTSGSTGSPKGVMTDHRGICNRLQWMQERFHLDGSDAVLQKTPFDFDVSVWEFFWPLISGARLVVARPQSHANPAYLAELIRATSITTLHFVPSMLKAFLEYSQLRTLPTLRRVMCSGEELAPDLVKSFFYRFEDVELHNLYGPTEASIDVSHWQCRPHDELDIVPIGRPISNMQLYVLDRDANICPVGVAGELYIGGIGLARGYLNRAALTAEKFVTNPFHEDARRRLFKTGDRARYRADGNIEFLGRCDDQVKITGNRVELGEIETILVSHHAIRHAVVVAREGAQGEKRLVAYFVPVDQPGPTAHQLRQYLKRGLPAFMVPSNFIPLESLPLTSNGKVDRRTLPTPDRFRPDLSVAYAAPCTPYQREIAEIVGHVLDIDRVGIHDNFFDLGGTSYQILQASNALSEKGYSVSPELFFQYQTTAELAEVVDQSRAKPNATVASQPSATPSLTGTATTSQTNTLIESLGIYLPSNELTTDEVLRGCLGEITFPLAEMTGIETRRMAADHESSVELAKRATEECLALSRYDPSDVDLLICASISRTDENNSLTLEPCTSVRLRDHFGFDNAITFDINNACAGFFTAIKIVDVFLKTGSVDCALVVSGEHITPLMRTAQLEIEEFMDPRLACLTLGDAGAAVMLERSPGQEVGFHEIDLRTLSRYWPYCIARVSDREHGGHIMFTDSLRTTSVAMRGVHYATPVLRRAEWNLGDIEHLIVHQTSRKSIQDAVREINSLFLRPVLDPSVAVDNLAPRGNTATTSHFVAMRDHTLRNRMHSGDKVIFGITGSGMNVGTALYTLDGLPERIRTGTKRSRDASYRRTKERASIDVVHCSVSIESVGLADRSNVGQHDTIALSTSAARECLRRSSVDRSEIGLLIYAGVYRSDHLFEPSIASIIAGNLQINDDVLPDATRSTFSFDVFNSSLGLLNACHVAVRMMAARETDCVLLVASEIENNAGSASADRRGVAETGSAMILKRSREPRRGFGQFEFESYTQDIGSFSAKFAGGRGQRYVRFDRHGNWEAKCLDRIPAVVRRLLQREHLETSDIDVVFPPQISPEFVSHLCRRLDIPHDRYVALSSFGNDLFTSSLPYSLYEAQRCDLAQPGNIGLIINVGTGIQVGCAVYYL